MADTCRGREIKAAITDFFRTAVGHDSGAPVKVIVRNGQLHEVPALAELVVYLGHDGLMDFQLGETVAGDSKGKRQVMILA